MFGRLLRAYRIRSGLTQEELAARTGLGVRTVRDLEIGHTGRPRPATLRVLADAFELAGDDRMRFNATALTAGRTPDRAAGRTPAHGPTGEPASGPARAGGYHRLDPRAAQLFRLFALVPGAVLTGSGAASLAGRTVEETRPALAELVLAGLVVERPPDQYTLDPGVRDRAADLLHATDPPAERRAALTRLLDHATHRAVAAELLINPLRDPIRVPLAATTAGTVVERPTSQPRAWAWLSTQRPTLLTLLELAVDAGFDANAWQLAWALTTVLERQGRWPELAGAWRAATAAAARLGDPCATAEAQRHTGLAAAGLGRYSDAHRHLQRTLAGYTRCGDHLGRANAERDLGAVWLARGRPERALEHAVRAGALFAAIGRRRGEAAALALAGHCRALLGDDAGALRDGERALTLHRRVGDRAGEAAALTVLGLVRQRTGRPAEAIACYRGAARLYRAIGADPLRAAVEHSLARLRPGAG